MLKLQTIPASVWFKPITAIIFKKHRAILHILVSNDPRRDSTTLCHHLETVRRLTVDLRTSTKAAKKVWTAKTGKLRRTRIRGGKFRTDWRNGGIVSRIQYISLVFPVCHWRSSAYSFTGKCSSRNSHNHSSFRGSILVWVT
jgi:hypothetical protein